MVHDVYFGIHVDLSASVVYVAYMLRFCRRYGNFFISVELRKFAGKNFSDKNHGGFNLRVDFFILADTLRASGLLLYVLALPFTRVINGAVPYKLA